MGEPWTRSLCWSGTLPEFSGNLSGLSPADRLYYFRGTDDLRRRSLLCEALKPQGGTSRTTLAPKGEEFSLSPLGGTLSTLSFLYLGLWQPNPGAPQTTEGLSPERLPGVVSRSERNRSDCRCLWGQRTPFLYFPTRSFKVCSQSPVQLAAPLGRIPTHPGLGVGWDPSWRWLTLTLPASFSLRPLPSVPVDPAAILICGRTCSRSSEWWVLPLLFLTQSRQTSVWLSLLPADAPGGSAMPLSRPKMVFSWWDISKSLLIFALTLSMMGCHQKSLCPPIRSGPFSGQTDALTEIATTNRSFIPFGNQQLVFLTRGPALFLRTHPWAIFLKAGTNMTPKAWCFLTWCFYKLPDQEVWTYHRTFF